MGQEERALVPARSEAAPSAPPAIVVQAPPRGALGTLVQGLVILLLLLLFGATVLVLFSLASLLGMPGQVAGGVGDRLGGAAAGAGRALESASRAVRDAADPARPPTGLTYDVQFSALHVVSVGSALPGGAEYVVTVQGIRRRDDQSAPELALYAQVRAELRQPRETRILGQVVRTDRDQRDHVLYRGESFRIGRQVYRVNWVSLEERALAIAVYRHPDEVTGGLKFEYD